MLVMVGGLVVEYWIVFVCCVVEEVVDVKVKWWVLDCVLMSLLDWIFFILF